MFDTSGLQKVTEGMIELNQNDGFLSPHAEQPDQSIGIFLKEKFTKLHHRQKEQIIKNAIHNLYGRHNAVNYEPHYNFRERWQQLSRPTFFQGGNHIAKSQNMMPPLMQLTLFFLYACIIWFLTIYRLFDTPELVFQLVSVIILTQCKDICVKQYFIRKAIAQNHYAKNRLTWEDYLRLHWGNLLFLPYCALIIFQNKYFDQLSLWLSVLDYFFVWRAYLRSDELYNSIKIRVMASKHRNEIQVIQLLARCICAIHFVGIILFFVSKINKEENWTNNIHDFQQDWRVRYLFSLYFASTTLTTVGYGDITPKNQFEIATILITQVFGIINFGYIINEIGRILAKINERQEALTKNISQAQNLSQTYKIPEILAFQMRSFIVNNQIAHDQLNVQEEDNFLRKLNDEIRQGFYSFHHIRIIKSSVFFLCHWSKKFQRKIASKLVRNIYSPQQTLAQVKGKQKLYILTRGKIDVIACLADHLLPIAIRPLKVIQINPANEVHFNVYGYSHLISGLNINIRAVIRDYAICYTLGREDFTSSMIEDQRDFQYFHQIKARIEQSYFRQIWQAPSITNTREHYLPNPYYILMKSKFRSKKKHRRKEVNRKYKKTKSYIQSQVHFSSQELESEDSIQTNTKEENLIDKLWCENTIFPENERLNAKQRKMKYDNIVNANNQQCLIKNRRYSQRPTNNARFRFFKDDQQRKIFEEQEAKQAIMNSFEYNAKFHGYFPKSNFGKVLQRYQKIYHKQMLDARSQISMRFDSKNQISEEVLTKLMNIKVFGSQNLE